MVPDLTEVKIGIIGLGYVGLPLAVEFSKKYEVVGYDINSTRIDELINGVDSTNELLDEERSLLSGIKFERAPAELSSCNVFIITVPTPVTKENYPDMSMLESASKLIGSFLKNDCVVIYESTVFPGATEEICIPILEKESGYKVVADFSVGYSPERINPGDKLHRLPDIKKVVSATCSASEEFLKQLYQSVINAGVYCAESIKVAEAAKVIENTQRDVNIALMNDLASLFAKIDIDTDSVLKAAETKWNFLPFKPGLVGGHCIGVDPYYLTFKAQSVGHNTDFILSGRRINEGVAGQIASRTVQKLVESTEVSKRTKILVMGCTFKENCPDVRNSKVLNLCDELAGFGVQVSIWDPYVSEIPNLKDNVSCIRYPMENAYSAIIVAVGHLEFINLGVSQIRKFGTDSSILFDVKSLFEIHESDLRL